VILLRRVLGDALRARRQAQHRTLREVSGAANVSLGYLSEIERGQKEASSELLSAICDALGAQLSDLLRDVSDTLELAELTESGLLDRGRRLTPAGVGAGSAGSEPGEAMDYTAPESPVDYSPPPPREPDAFGGTVTNFMGGGLDGGSVAVAVRHEGPLKTTLRAIPQRLDVVGV
jgi:transcriptional regulator with XRE-family HTH domain